MTKCKTHWRFSTTWQAELKPIASERCCGRWVEDARSQSERTQSCATAGCIWKQWWRVLMESWCCGNRPMPRAKMHGNSGKMLARSFCNAGELRFWSRFMGSKWLYRSRPNASQFSFAYVLVVDEILI